MCICTKAVFFFSHVLILFARCLNSIIFMCLLLMNICYNASSQVLAYRRTHCLNLCIFAFALLYHHLDKFALMWHFDIQ